MVMGKKEKALSELLEIEILKANTRHGKPKTPLLDESNSYHQLPISNRTNRSLVEFEISDIQRVCLPHALRGRDIFCLSKTHHPSSAKTLAFLIPVIEKLYLKEWRLKDGLGSMIICPTWPIAQQTFELFNAVGKHHKFKVVVLGVGVNAEKECLNKHNILIGTPGTILRHILDTPNFDSSKLEILGFARKLDAIISRLPETRQTLFFSTTQTMSVRDLARLSLKHDAECLSVDAEFETGFPFPVLPPSPTPADLIQSAIVVPLDEKLLLLWDILSKHCATKKVLVLLSTCEQVQFLFTAFKRLLPEYPFMCIHKGIDKERSTIIYSDFCASEYPNPPSILLSTDEVSRDLHFHRKLGLIIQADCPKDVNSYINRLCQPPRCETNGKSILLLLPSEMKMIQKLQAENIPIQVTKRYPIKELPICVELSYFMANDSKLRVGAEEAFGAYLRFVHKSKDKDIFDVNQLPLKKFSRSLGLVITPSVSFQGKKIRIEKISLASSSFLELIKRVYGTKYDKEEKTDDDNTLKIKLNIFLKISKSVAWSHQVMPNSSPKTLKEIKRQRGGRERKKNTLIYLFKKN
ncbi:hypothetical protein UlMin_004040 [Ulmus minor]